MANQPTLTYPPREIAGLMKGLLTSHDSCTLAPQPWLLAGPSRIGWTSFCKPLATVMVANGARVDDFQKILQQRWFVGKLARRKA